MKKEAGLFKCQHLKKTRDFCPKPISPSQSGRGACKEVEGKGTEKSRGGVGKFSTGRPAQYIHPDKVTLKLGK